MWDLCKSGSVSMGSGAPRSQVLTTLLKWLLTPEGSRRQTDHVLVKVGDQGLQQGIEATRASLEGRSGGGTDSVCGVVTASALAA
jgi:hypothetical protein